MVQGLIGKKLGMTQIFGDNAEAEAVTAIEAGPCTITQIKTAAKEGYNAVQLGFGEARRPKVRQQEQSERPKRFKYFREFEINEGEALEVGQSIDVSLFKRGDLVDVTGISKGKGFAGVVKRHHFAGGPKTHGQSDRHRAPGSIGATTSPGRVWKGQRMAGHMGNDRVTVRHLKVLEADPARNLLLIKGAAPGTDNALLIIRKSGRGASGSSSL